MRDKYCSAHTRRLVFAYKPHGFCEIGGLQRIAQNIVDCIYRAKPETELATLSRSASGRLNHSIRCTNLKRSDHLIIIGCDSAWAYVLAIIARLRGIPVSWLPSFHEPNHAIHRKKARLAQITLKAMQLLGIYIYAQTNHESSLLKGLWHDHCYLSSHGFPNNVRQRFEDAYAPKKTDTRPIDCLFFGRPTSQKGWDKFVKLAEITNLKCAAIVPTMPPSSEQCIQLHLKPDDQTIYKLLQNAKLVLIPSNYESFGIAQLEAVVAGCLVPILGRWPLWDDYFDLHWQNLSLDEISFNCQKLCQDHQQRYELAMSQWLYIRSHPITYTDMLPGLDFFL